MKILNCYAGIGGNRKYWDDICDCEITAVEYNPEIAEIYKHFWKNDTVVVGDAHAYLLDRFKEFDFIWCSPPCPTHSDIRRCGVHAGQYEAKYPDMSLYQEIILLKNFLPKTSRFCIENVKPYYEPLIIPDKVLHRHLYWCDFAIRDFTVTNDRKHIEIDGSYPGEVYGFNIDSFDIENRRAILRNMVDPDLGKHILQCAWNSLNGVSEFEDCPLFAQ